MVEINETYVGGTEGNNHESKKLNAGRGAAGKKAVVGFRERGGRTVAMPVDSADKKTLHNAIYAHPELGSALLTDEAIVYKGLAFFNHEAVNHLAGEYARGEVSTNGIESVWALLKRGIYGNGIRSV